MICIENLSFSYKKKDVFKELSLKIGHGAVYGLLGKNGAGKSTLLYLMAGLLTPGGGRISYRGEDVSKRLPSLLSDFFIISEEFSLPAIPLKKYVAINRPFYPRFSEEQLKANLELFELDMEVNLGALSMGQKKKVFMSFALAVNTSLLIMDEPTNGLDIPGKSQFRKFIAANMTEDRTIIISTHQVQDVENLIEHVLILEDNKILLNASVNEIADKLYFAESTGNIDLSEALYVAPTVSGYHAMFPNKEKKESPLNLEILFNGTLDSPGKIAGLMNNKE